MGSLKPARVRRPRGRVDTVPLGLHEAAARIALLDGSDVQLQPEQMTPARRIAAGTVALATARPTQAIRRTENVRDPNASPAKKRLIAWRTSLRPR